MSNNIKTITFKTDRNSGEPLELRWIDIERTDDFSKLDLAAILGTTLHERHLKDFKNSHHPPYYESTDEYEILIFRAVDLRFEVIAPRTRSTVFLLCKNTVVTIHDEGDNSHSRLYQKWLADTAKHPKDLPGLLHSLLDIIGNAYLELREPLTDQIQVWQQRLLDPNDPFDDWHVLMQARSSMRWLKVNLELQRETLHNWRNESRYQFTPSHIVHFNDLDDHFGRIERLSEAIRSDIDSLTAIHFASTGQKTNSIMQFLAVISAIFLPLNLIAGLFGMNFEIMPFIKEPWGVAAVLFAMLSLSIVLLWWFKKWRWY